MATFQANLRGRNVVPPVQTFARGTASFSTVGNNNVRALRFSLSIRNINQVTQAHIHLGQPGANGPIVATLFGPSKFGISVRRGIVTGTLTRSDLQGPLQGLSLRSLIREINRGNAYVDVHTAQYPNGQIRGQIR
ncbi:CHRD domain-containing protein [Paenibacillus sp. HB172176]|uniref:CHRD domain-containing protein n=1 Tax=Paenibacillus sp. HB172176 TaxID=2493690 RepID=UPI00143C5FB9|nr:CHRD domain-containing protein [Paenibacillus sp. HB172176]